MKLNPTPADIWDWFETLRKIVPMIGVDDKNMDEATKAQFRSMASAAINIAETFIQDIHRIAEKAR